MIDLWQEEMTRLACTAPWSASHISSCANRPCFSASRNGMPCACLLRPLLPRSTRSRKEVGVPRFHRHSNRLERVLDLEQTLPSQWTDHLSHSSLQPCSEILSTVKQVAKGGFCRLWHSVSGCWENSFHAFATLLDMVSSVIQSCREG